VTVNVSEPRSGVLLVEIDRPGALNALDVSTFRALGEAWGQLQESSNLRAAVVTGAGSRAFCAGADTAIVDQLAHHPEVDDFYKAMLATALPDKPIIAAVNGHAIGGGLTIVLGSDLRLASPNATFGLPISKLASHPKWLVPGIMGQVSDGVAVKMVLLGERISAAEALRAGLISDIVEGAQLRSRALDAAEFLAGLDPFALGSLVSSIRAARRGWPELRAKDEQASEAVMRRVRRRGLMGLSQ
jgi:E-phenylitaconyl-CoA hydratase